MSKAVFGIAVLTACASIFMISAAGQKPDNPPEKKDAPPVSPCPQLAVNAPTGRTFKEGERIALSAALVGGETTASPSFVWTTSSGVVENGQGSRSVTIDSTGAAHDRQINVGLWVGGYPPECVLQASATLKVAPPAAKLAEFSELTPEEETQRINETIALIPSLDNIYVLGYAGRRNIRGYANVVLKRIKAEFLAGGIQYERMAFIDGGYRDEPAFEIWSVPHGADAPRAKPTVPAKEIVFPKTAPTASPKKP